MLIIVSFFLDFSLTYVIVIFSTYGWFVIFHQYVCVITSRRNKSKDAIKRLLIVDFSSEAADTYFKEFLDFSLLLMMSMSC